MFHTNEMIDSVVTVEINGLAEQQGIGFIIETITDPITETDSKTYVILLGKPSINSNISIGYLY